MNKNNVGLTDKKNYYQFSLILTPDNRFNPLKSFAIQV